MKHTSGPWRPILNHQHGILYGIYCDSQKGPIARDVLAVDRHLIAAAPDLLEACRQALVQLDYHHVSKDAYYILIKKAV